jgi:hypothetical protein
VGKDPEICQFCNVVIAPANPERHSGKVKGRVMVAHRACVCKHGLPEARSKVKRLVEKYASESSKPKLRLDVVSASGYKATAHVLRVGLKSVYMDGIAPRGCRLNAVRRCAREVENLLMDDFTSCLEATDCREPAVTDLAGC